MNPFDKRKPAVFLPADFSGCAYFRMEQPSKHPSLKNVVDYMYPSNKITTKQLASTYKTIVVQRIFELGGVTCIREFQQFKAAVINEIDDSPWTLADNEHPVRLSDVQLMACNKGIQEADIVVASTEPLAECITKNTGRKGIVVIPNCINLDAYLPFPMPSTDDKIRIYWQGSPTHDLDMREASLALMLLFMDNPNIQLVIHGNIPSCLIDTIPPNRIERISPSSCAEYLRISKSVKADIGICPLNSNAFTRCKSNLKWLEMTAKHLPVIASDAIPYNQCIEHGKTGFLAKNSSDWTEYLNLLISDATLRKQIAANARAEVKQNWHVGIQANKWLEVIRSAGGL